MKIIEIIFTRNKGKLLKQNNNIDKSILKVLQYK